MTMPVTGLVLAGGHSRRMGRDKAMLPYGDSTLLQAAVSKIAAFCSPVYVLSSHAGHQVPGTETLPDAYPDQGPLGGILTGLQAAPTPWSLVLACDMPRITPALLDHLLAQTSVHPTAEVLLFSENDRPQPLCALYSRSVIPKIQAALAANELRMMKIIQQLDTRITPASANLEAWFPGVFENWNTPEDYQKTKAMKVNILLFGSLREKMGFAEKQLEFSDTEALRSWLEGQHPELGQLNYLLAVNQELIRDNQPLQEGDEIAVMPPFAGG